MLESCVGAPSSGQKHAKVCYHFVARNTNELSVIQGDILEVLEDDKQWWRLRSRSGQEGYVPCNILKLLDQPPPRKPAGLLITQQPSQPPKVPPAPAPAPVGVSAPVSVPVRAPVRASERGGERVERSKSPQDKDSRTQVNDELLQRITASKSQPPVRNFRVERPAGTPLPLTHESQPWEVSAWLNAKGFSKMTVNCLGILTGAQLFSLNKEELKAVCGDEGARVFSQVTVQKTQLEGFQGSSELQEIMRRRQEEVDAFAYD